MPNQNTNTAAGGLKEEALLLGQLSQGSMEAFTKIYDHYQPRLRLFIAPFTHYSPSATNEIIQEVFVKLWIKRTQLTGIAMLEYYLQRMAKNHLFDKARLLQIKKRHEDRFASSQASGHSGIEEALQLKEYHALAQEAIRKLPERRLLLFRLSALEGYSLEEIQVQTGLSKEVIKKQLFKARQFIRQHLEQKGGIQ